LFIKFGETTPTLGDIIPKKENHYFELVVEFTVNQSQREKEYSKKGKSFLLIV
jgi:hypothetical protein